MTRDMDNIYKYHEPTGDEQRMRYRDMRQSAKLFAEQILRDCPTSREQSLALTKLEEVVMWANAGIARYPRAADES